MGRRSLVAKGRFSEADVLAAWKQSRTIIGTAKYLQVAQLTAYRYLKRLGIATAKRGKPPGLPTPHTSSLIAWVRQHPTTPLPRSVTRIATATGCPANVVKTYLYRRRRHFRRAIAALPDLRKTRLKFKIKSTLVPFRMVKRYEILFDPWTFKLRLVLWLAGKRYVFALNNLKALKL